MLGESLRQSVADNKKTARPHKSSSHVRWKLVLVLFLLSATMFLDRVNFSISGNTFRKEYHLSEVQLGWIVSAFLIGYGLLQAPAGKIVDRFGPRLVVSGAVCWWALFTVLTTAIPHWIGSPLSLLIIVRFLLGAGEAFFYPACSQFMSHWIPITERGRANGLIFAGVGIGAGLAPPLITLCLLNFGWRFSFWACAVIGLTLGAIWLASGRNKPESHLGVSDAELNLIQTGIVPKGTATRDPGAKDRARSARQLRLITQSWNVWAISATYFCFGYVAWLFFSWFYIYLAEVRGVDLRASALYGMLPFIGMVFGSIFGGILSDRATIAWGVRTGCCFLSSAAMAIAALLLVAGARIGDAALASVALSAGAGILYLAQSSFWSVSVGVGGPSSGLLSGIMNMGAQAGGALTATLTPWIAMRFGWNSSFSAAGVIAILGAVLWLTVRPDRQLVAQEAGTRATTV